MSKECHVSLKEYCVRFSYLLKQKLKNIQNEKCAINIGFKSYSIENIINK